MSYVSGGSPLKFWSDCVLTFVYWINRLPSSILNGKTLYELVHNKKPNISDNAHFVHVLVALFVYLCIVFGCVCEHYA